LLGNAANACVLEVNTPGLLLRFNTATVIVLSGADLSAELQRADGLCAASPYQVSPYVVTRVAAGDTLCFRRFVQRGMRGYLAVLGGFWAPPPSIAGSYSCVPREGLGGHRGDGQALQRDDRLYLAAPERSYDLPYLQALPYRLRPNLSNLQPICLELRLGYQAHYFDQAALAQLLQQSYRLSAQSDRMAYRLQPSQPIALPAALQQGIVSEPIALGALQITPDGEPIIMLQDRQTIGGYVKVGVIVAASLQPLVQAMPGQTLRLQLAQ
ncbi:MAG: hypothetical protein HRU21_03130, partial [Pseudomonadales bacterium]|nr:hypothetical protein [Pseudomonadales bacterium]